MHASLRVPSLWGARKLTEVRLPCVRNATPTDRSIFWERFECEHACWDPKGGELCLSRVRPAETLVEARRCADVQIAFVTRV